MSELITNAKETYQDLAVAVSGPNYERDRCEILKKAFNLYLLCERQDKQISELLARGGEYEADRDG